MSLFFYIHGESVEVKSFLILSLDILPFILQKVLGYRIFLPLPNTPMPQRCHKEILAVCVKLRKHLSWRQKRDCQCAFRRDSILPKLTTHPLQAARTTARNGSWRSLWTKWLKTRKIFGVLRSKSISNLQRLGLFSFSNNLWYLWHNRSSIDLQIAINFFQ